MYEWVFERVYKHLGRNPLLDMLDTATLRRYFMYLIERSYKPASISIHYRVLHAFFVWCVRECLIAANPLDGIPKPKMPKIFPFMLDDHQVSALLKANDTSTRHGCRNQAMLLLFLDCGLHLNELINVHWNDVSLANRSLKVHGKGAKDRYLSNHQLIEI